MALFPTSQGTSYLNFTKNLEKNKSKCEDELNTLLQSLKSTESDNNYILARSRGGLVAPNHHLMGIVEEAEILFRKNIGEGEQVLRI